MRQVQVFKWIQERNGDGKLQNVRAQDGMATFHQFGAAYEEFENGAGSYAIAIIERADGSVQQVNADMIQFIEPTAAPVPYDDLVAVLREAARYGIGKWEFDDRSQDEIDGGKEASDEAIDAILARLDAA